MHGSPGKKKKKKKKKKKNAWSQSGTQRIVAINTSNY
jgi:hypothetical protein